MEGEVGAVEVGIVAFDRDDVLSAGFEEFGEVSEGEEIELAVGFVQDEVAGRGAAAFGDALTEDFVSVEVEDEGIVVGDCEPESGSLGVGRE